MKKTVVKAFILLFLGTIGSITFAHFYLLDGIDGWLLSLILTEDTLCVPDYSEKAFRQIHQGMNKQNVVNSLGMPLSKSWFYQDSEEGKLWIWFDDDGEVSSISFDSVCKSTSQFTAIEKGTRQDSVLKILGKPMRESWVYSKSPGSTHFKIRSLILKDERVVEKFHEFYVD